MSGPDTDLVKALAGSSRDEWILFFIGLLVAVGLATFCRLAAPRGKRVPLTAGAALYLLHVAFFGARQLMPTPTIRSALGSASVVLGALALGRLLFLALFDVMITRRRAEPLPRIVRDIIQGLLFFFLFLWSLRAVGVEPGSLLTTSALLTVVAGLALQETLGNLVAGLAIQIDKPFEIGDWIQIHDHELSLGRVLEVNWRSTRVRTLDNVVIALPNGLIAKAAVTNFSRPIEAPRRSIRFLGPFGTSPLSVRAAVLAAVKGAPGVLPEPAPSVVTEDFADSGIQYWVRYFVADMSRRDAIDGEVRDRIWTALARAGIGFPFPTRTLHIHEVTEDSRAKEAQAAVAARREILAKVEILSLLPPAELQRLAERTSSVPYATGEAVVTQGDPGDTMFVVQRGEVAVTVPGRTGPHEISRLSPGAHFGEMSLLTGAPRSATVVATAPCELLRIDHAAFRDIIVAQPEVVRRISETITEHQRRLESTGTLLATPAVSAGGEAPAADLFERVRRFFAGN